MDAIGRNRSPAGTRIRALFGKDGQSGTCAVTVYSVMTYVGRTGSASPEGEALARKKGQSGPARRRKPLC